MEICICVYTREHMYTCVLLLNTHADGSNIGLVYLSNGISTFVCYLMPKLSLEKNSRDTINLIEGDKVFTFALSISLEVKSISRLEFELAY